MKFIYFYSPLYDYYHKHISSTLSNHFEVDPIYIDDIQPKNGHTFFFGVSVKIDILIQKIKENLGDYILFSDATIFINEKTVNNLVPFFECYKENDLTFVDENETKNIGLILVKCNEETLLFFEKCLHVLKSTQGWDQHVINEELKQGTILKIGTFDFNKIIIGYKFREQFRNTFYIFKIFTIHQENKEQMFNNRLKVLYDANLITKEEYDNNLKLISPVV